MDSKFIMEFTHRCPDMAPVSSKEDLIDRVTDGLVPSKRAFRVYVTPEGELLSENEAARRLADSINVIYDQMTEEELATFKEMLSHIYQRRSVQQRTAMVTGGALIGLAIIAWQLIKHLR